jgi:2-polyprenyl-3-methyl-5-hydroxy-6-metoxy-1,4-benzoquinol methylase
MDQSCPYCGTTQTSVLGHKYFLVQLRKCQNCGLMFRFPKDKPAESNLYYQLDYQQQGLTTNLPDNTELQRLLDTSFKNTSKDLSQKINLVKSYISKGKALDYGCSWGYGVWQLNQAGYETIGFEISLPRTEFGRKYLGVDIIDRQAELENLPDESFDLIFTNHVLEHLPDISQIFSLFWRLLKAGGILTIIVPNCNACDTPSGFKQKQQIAFGEKHTIAFDSNFLSKAISENSFQKVTIKNGTELVLIAKKTN